jgi:hypothetical protein
MRLSIYHTWEFIVPMPKLDSSGRNFNGGGNYPSLIDVVFDGETRVSSGHFTD